MNLSFPILYVTTLLTGFLGGIGFLNFMGFNPALQKTPVEDLVRYWQHLDGKMSVRMPVFGTILLIFLIAAAVSLFKQSYKLPFVLIILSLVIVLVDFYIATQFNFPFNKTMQSITPETIPENLNDLRNRSVVGFNLRSVCMIGTFVLNLTALFIQTFKGLPR